MNITIIGAGNMGSGLANRLALAGHRVTVTARDPAKAQALAAGHPNIVAAGTAEAPGAADVVFVATGFSDAIGALGALGDLSGRIVVDITNPLSADYMALTLGHSTSAAEQIAAAIPGAQVVKAFNTVLAQVLANGPELDGRPVQVFHATDSERARQTVRVLIESMGFSPVDAGPLKNARYLEPVAGLNIYFAYGAGEGTAIAPAWSGIGQ